VAFGSRPGARRGCRRQRKNRCRPKRREPPYSSKASRHCHAGVTSGKPGDQHAAGCRTSVTRASRKRHVGRHIDQDSCTSVRGRSGVAFGSLPGARRGCRRQRKHRCRPKRREPPYSSKASRNRHAGVTSGKPWDQHAAGRRTSVTRASRKRHVGRHIDQVRCISVRRVRSWRSARFRARHVDAADSESIVADPAPRPPHSPEGSHNRHANVTSSAHRGSCLGSTTPRGAA
jgi:hypothetical protein